MGATTKSGKRGAAAPGSRPVSGAGVAAPPSATPRRLDWARALVLAAIVVGCALRFVNLAGVPPALNQDEAVNGYDAYSLILTGRDHLGHPFPLAGLESFGDWASPLLTFLTAPAVGLFGLHVATLRAVSAALGVLAIPLLYLLGVELFRRRAIGVLAAWCIAISPWPVHLSRWAIPPAVVPPTLALTLWLFVRAVHRRSDRGLVAAAVAAGLTIAGYPTMKLYVPLLGLALVALYWPVLIRFRREALGYAAGALLLIAGPIIYLSTLDPGARARLDQVSAFKDHAASLPYLARQYASYFSPRFLFAAGDGDPMHSPPGFGIEPRWLAPFLLLGLIWLVVRALRPPTPGDRRPALAVLAALVLYPVPGSLTLPSPHTLRAVQLIPLAALLAAVGAVAAADVLRRLLTHQQSPAPRYVLALFCAAALLPLGLELGGQYRHYFTRYPDQVMAYFQYGLQQALGYARVHEAGYDDIWVADTNQPYIYVLFFDRWPPSEVHRSLVVYRNPPWFNQVSAFGEYHFGRPPNVDLAALPVVDTVSYPRGGIAYELRGGLVNGRRTLVIYRP